MIDAYPSRKPCIADCILYEEQPHRIGRHLCDAHPNRRYQTRRAAWGLADVCWSRSQSSDDGTGLPLRHEIVLESMLDLPIGKWLNLQPDMQYIIDPGGTAAARNATVVGLRAIAHL